MKVVNHFEIAIELDEDTPGYKSIYNYLAQILIEKIDDTEGKSLIKLMFDKN